jgi:NADPH2 dehydrogenase
MSSVLFTPFALRGTTLPNRIVVAPMCQYIAEDGNAGDWHLMHLGQFAMGAAGLVFTEATAVAAEGRITHGCLGLYSDANEAALARVVQFCRRHGVATLGIQLAHAGRKGSARVPLAGGAALADGERSWTTLAPSALPYGPGWHTPKPMTAADLDATKEAFVRSAERAARLGFDVVELHMAHGYLLHQFLSPIANRRDDRYGGSSENRMRYPLEVFEAVRAALPAGLPLGVRLSATDWVEGGWTPDETVALAKRLKALGCDFVDVSTGGLDPRQMVAPAPGYQVPFADRIRREAGIPTMAVGLIADPLQAEAIVASGQADFVALARAMMDDPRWAWRAAAALGADTPYASQYARAHPGVWPGAKKKVA